MNAAEILALAQETADYAAKCADDPELQLDLLETARRLVQLAETLAGTAPRA